MANTLNFEKAVKEVLLAVVSKIAEQDYPKRDGEDLHLAYFMGLLEGKDNPPSDATPLRCDNYRYYFQTDL